WCCSIAISGVGNRFPPRRHCGRRNSPCIAIRSTSRNGQREEDPTSRSFCQAARRSRTSPPEQRERRRRRGLPSSCPDRGTEDEEEKQTKRNESGGEAPPHSRPKRDEDGAGEGGDRLRAVWPGGLKTKKRNESGRTTHCRTPDQGEYSDVSKCRGEDHAHQP